MVREMTSPVVGAKRAELLGEDAKTLMQQVSFLPKLPNNGLSGYILY